MSAFDYEAFLKKIQENNASMLDSEDSADFYKELRSHKEKQCVALKANLDDLQKNNRSLKRKHVLCEVFYQELLQTRESMIQANAVLHKEVLKAEQSRQERLAKYLELMDDLEKRYFEFGKVMCNSDSLKTKLAELKEKKSALEEEYNTMTAELQSIVDSMKNMSILLPNADAVKQIEREVSKECEDLTVKQLELEKIKRFLKDFEEKINSN